LTRQPLNASSKTGPGNVYGKTGHDGCLMIRPHPEGGKPADIVGKHIRHWRQNGNTGNEKPAPEKPERVNAKKK